MTLTTRNRLLSALMRFSMALKVTPDDLQAVQDVERNCAKHISVVNDIYSWEKEVLAAQTGHTEGAALCSSVQVVAHEAGIDTEASKRVLWAMCREWERCHQEMLSERRAAAAAATTADSSVSPAVWDYVQGLEYQMSGNELWSQTTKRYIGVGERDIIGVSV